MKQLPLVLSALVFLAAVQAKAEDKPAADKSDTKKDSKKMKKKGMKMKEKGMKMEEGHEGHGPPETSEAPPAK